MGTDELAIPTLVLPILRRRRVVVWRVTHSAIEGRARRNVSITAPSRNTPAALRRRARNRDAGALRLHHGEQSRGIAGRQPHAAMRCRAAERTGRVRAMDGIAA